jgi:uncharacterized membrane protein YfcA
MLRIGSLDPKLAIILLLVGVPACYLNNYLLKWIQPKRSFKRLVLYLAAVLAMTLIIIGGLLKYAWPVR